MTVALRLLRLRLVRCFLVCLSVVAASLGSAAAGEPIQGRALLIGIENYTSAPRLPGVSKDVQDLADTLRERGGYKVKEITNSAKGDDFELAGKTSELQSLKDAIQKWLQERKDDETVLVYFSGHGFRDKNDHLYLAVADCNPADPEPGGIPLAWLREQLVVCKGRLKLLVLDACHAGSTRSAAGARSVPAKDLGDFFKDTQGLVTLASCTGQQTSLMWPEKKHSLFTYWLAQGLCGHADREPLGQITVNELDDFIARKVRWSAQKIHSAEQTPTRLQGPGVTEDVLLELQPSSYKQLLDDMAEQMDVLVRLGGIERVGVVPEFTSGKTGQVLGREYGALATNCPVELSDRLAEKGQGQYRVISTGAVRELLQEKGVAPQDIGTSKCRGISVEGRQMMALIGGRIESLKSGILTLQCSLIDTASGDIYGTAGGMARLCGSEMAMQGGSGRAEAVSLPDSSPDAPPQLEAARIDTSAQHPLRDPTFPYRVRIIVKTGKDAYSNREGTFRGNDCLVPLRKGEVFQICVANRSQQPVFARVLVDGLNTLPERSQQKGVYVEPVEQDEYRQAQPVNLAEARAWGPIEPSVENGIAGFYLQTGSDAQVDEFTVGDAAQSIASEAGYTDQLGLITVAFYEPQKKSPRLSRGVTARSAVGMVRGNRYQTRTDTYTGDYEPGRLLAVVNIRYGE